MKIFGFTLLVVVVSAVGIFFYPEKTINPGPLSRGHEKIKNECMSCHTAFLGVDGEKCVSCHKLADIDKSTDRKFSHMSLSSNSCISCHTDHQGLENTTQIKGFSHDLLQDDDVTNCDSCHKKPEDSLHIKLATTCSQCHETEKWKPASFDHKDYFRFDRRHPANCEDCHDAGNYQQYTCYNCHEHSPSNIRSEHYEEGIFRYEDCAECHPSGNEHDAKYKFKSNYRHYEHEDDDD